MTASFQTSAYSGRNVASMTALPSNSIRRIIIQPLEFEGRNEIMRRLEHLQRLPRGWDGYQGIGVSWPLASFCLGILERIMLPGTPVPQLIPGSDGTLQIEWHVNGFDIELDIRGANDVCAWVRNNDTSEEFSAELTNDFTMVSDHVANMTNGPMHAVVAAA